MAEVGSATVAIVPTFTGFRSKISDEADGAGKESGGRFASSFKGLVGPALALAGSGIFAGFIGEAARASDATDKFKATMNFAGMDTSQIDEATRAAKEFADQTVYDLPTIQNTIAQLASNGVADYTGLTKAAGNLNAVAGGNADTFKSVAMVMTQTAGAGKLTTENWNQMADAIPGAAGPLMRSLEEAGAYTGNFRDAMAAGEITADEFNESLMKLGNDPVAVEAAKSVSTFEGAIGGLQATINSGLMGALDAMKPAITGAINGVSTGLGAAFDWIGNAFTGLTDLFGKGDFSAAFRNAFHVEEDSGVVNFLFTIRDGVLAAKAAFSDGDITSDGFVGVMERIGAAAKEVTGGVQAFFAAFKAGDGEVTSSGFAGMLEGLGGKARELADQIGPVIGSIFSQIGPVLAPLIPQFLSLFSSISPLQTVFQAIQPLLPQLLDVFVQLATVVGQSLGQALTALLPVFVTLQGVFISVFQQVLATALPVIVQLVTMLGATFAQLLPIIVPIITTLAGLAVTLISQLMPIFMQLVSTVLPMVVTIFGAVLQAIGPLISMLAGLLIPIIQALMPVVVTVFSVIADVIASAMQIVMGIIQVVTGIISGNWSQVWEGIQNIFSGIWNTILAVVKGVLQTIGQVVISGLGLIGNFVGSTLEGIGRFFADTWNNITRGVGGFIDGFLGFFRDLPGKIMGALSGAGTWLLGIGKNIIDGLINGITGAAGAVARAIANLVPEAIRGPIEAALGIHSPSRVAMWWGEMIGDGLAGGIDDSQRKVASSMGSLVSIPNVTGAVGSTAAGLGGAGQVNNITINQVDDPIGTSTAVARRLRAVSV
jgi:tape measure domain-containing protein